MLALNLVIAVLMLSGGTLESTPYSWTVAQMQGGCGDYTADLHSEMKLMSGRLTSVAAGSGVADAAQIRPGVAYSVHLLSQQQVHFVLPPGQNRNGAERAAGILSLGHLPAGNWRISLDNPAWIDLLASGRIVNSSTFEMKTGCTTILKTVVFALRGQARVLLQVNGATRPSVRLVVTPAAASAR